MELRKNQFSTKLKELEKDNFVEGNIDIKVLAEMGEGFSTADIVGVIQNANNDAYSRVQDLFEKGEIEQKDIDTCPEGKISMQDLIHHIQKIRSNKGLPLKEALKAFIENKTQELRKAGYTYT